MLSGPSSLFILCPLPRALTRGPLTLAGSFPGGDHLKTSPASLPPPAPSTLLPCSHNPSCDKQWEVWTLTSSKTLKTESRGAELPEIADVGRMDTLSAGLWEALEGLKDALSCQCRLVGCCLLNSITSHFKSQLLQTVLCKRVLLHIILCICLCIPFTRWFYKMADFTKMFELKINMS